MAIERFGLQHISNDLPAGRQVRQKKKKFKKQEHFTLSNLRCRIDYFTGQAFIDWFIAVPAKITISGHQIESKIANTYKNKNLVSKLKCMRIIFTKTLGKSLTGSSKRHRNKESLPAVATVYPQI